MTDGYYLITGGAGFIGSHFVEAILSRNDSSVIIILDNLSTGKKSNIPNDPGIEFILGDITDKVLLERLFNKYNFNYIFHLAAVSSVQDSIENPELTHSVNFDATLSLLEKARKLKKLKRFVYTSSAAVYGNEPRLPCSEGNPVNPISPYGVDKYASERYVLDWNNLFDVPTTVFRFFNVYGPRQNTSSPYSGVISIFAERILNREKDVRVYGDGLQTRDFIYVKDVVDAVLCTIKLEKSRGKVYNLGTGMGVSIIELINDLEKITGRKIEIDYREERKGDIRHSYSDITALRELGYDKEFIDILVGLKNLLKY